MIKSVVVTDAWLSHEKETVLNPLLKPYEKQLLAMQQSWGESVNHTPLTWYAEHLAKVSPVELLLHKEEHKNYAQYWMVTPYHVRLIRSTLRMMPESMLNISQNVVEQLESLINPLLADAGLELFVRHGNLFLGCKDKWDVSPENFANFNGGFLPNRMPEGKDAGAWMRMLSEVQMTLHQNPIINEEGLAIHGLWFWGASACDAVADLSSLDSVATKHQQLAGWLSRMGKDSKPVIIISEAENLPYLLPAGKKLPAQWLLLGAGNAVTLKKSVVRATLARVRKNSWQGIRAGNRIK